MAAISLSFGSLSLRWPNSPTRFISSSKVGPLAVISAMRRFASSTDSGKSDSAAAASVTTSATSSAASSASAFFAVSSVGRRSAQFTVLPSDFGSFASPAPAFLPDLLPASSADFLPSLSATPSTSAVNALSSEIANNMMVRKYPAIWISLDISRQFFAVKFSSAIMNGLLCKNVRTTIAAMARKLTAISGSLARIKLVDTMINSHDTMMMHPRMTQLSVDRPLPVIALMSCRIAPAAYSSAGIAISPSAFLAANHRKTAMRTIPPSIRHHP